MIICDSDTIACSPKYLPANSLVSIPHLSVDEDYLLPFSRCLTRHKLEAHVFTQFSPRSVPLNSLQWVAPPSCIGSGQQKFLAEPHLIAGEIEAAGANCADYI